MVKDSVWESGKAGVAAGAGTDIASLAAPAVGWYELECWTAFLLANDDPAKLNLLIPNHSPFPPPTPGNFGVTPSRFRVARVYLTQGDAVKVRVVTGLAVGVDAFAALVLNPLQEPSAR